MRRRDFIVTLGAVTATWPLTVALGEDRARSYRIGILVQAPRTSAHWRAFFDELQKSGFSEGGNLSIIDGFNTPADRAEDIAKAIVRQGPDIILTAGVFTKVVQHETQSIPILTVSDDLLAEHAVASLAHPGANTTGISILATELDSKRQEILLEAVPHARSLAILVDPNVTEQRILEQLIEGARAHGVSVSVHRASDGTEIIPAMDAALGAGAHALNVLASSLLNRYRAQIIAHAADLRLPAIYQWPEMVEEGGLMAYGPRFVTLYRQHAHQAQKVLEGAKPADIPVEQPANFELAVNLKTAKAIGVELPISVRLRADEVIE